MEKPLKRKRKTARPRQALSLALLGLALAAGLVFWYAASKTAGKFTQVPDAYTHRTLSVRKAEEVSRISVARQEGEDYMLVMENGRLTVMGWPEFVMDTGKEKALLDASAILSVEDTVSESRDEWEPHKADFGLNPPAVTVEVEYSDGKTAVYSLGAKAPHNNWHYFTLKGDPGLYLASADLIDLFEQDLTAFHQVNQPVIHRQRIDRITIQSGSGAIDAAWELETDVADRNAPSAWRMTAPFLYPCDSAAMETMTSAMEKLYLGRFVSTATKVAKAQYGFSPPRRVITVHQAAGQIATIGESGVYEITPYPESTLTLTIGTQGDEYVDYVMVDDTIYLVSSISQPLLNKLMPENTLQLQPAAIALDLIQSVVVEKNGGQTTYMLRRVERLLPNNELAYDEEGNVLFDTFVDVDGREASFSEFEAVMTAMQTVTVSGRLPDGYAPDGNLTARIVFTFRDGRTRSLEIAAFDALHDALGVDGTYLHYLPKGALGKGL